MILVVSAVIVTGDTVWVYPFSELGADWEYSSWIPVSNGAYMDDSHSGGYGGSYYYTYPMSSGTMNLPGEYDSVTVEMNSGYAHSGYTMDSSVSASLSIEADTGAGVFVLQNFTDSHSTWNHASFNVTDTTFISQTVPFNSGDTITLNFLAVMEGGGYLYGNELLWCVWDMVITGHENTGLNAGTWAGIKSAF